MHVLKLTFWLVPVSHLVIWSHRVGCFEASLEEWSKRSGIIVKGAHSSMGCNVTPRFTIVPSESRGTGTARMGAMKRASKTIDLCILLVCGERPALKGKGRHLVHFKRSPDIIMVTPLPSQSDSDGLESSEDSNRS